MVSDLLLVINGQQLINRRTYLLLALRPLADSWVKVDKLCYNVIVNWVFGLLSVILVGRLPSPARTGEA